ncbi:pentapeptide repeat-containing protein [Bacillus velezensis]|uniref:pentapeptide repeat-containing protein n=1 Tax=Bacillus velezensis TaxID=492670 RepID=UPI003EBF025D
MNYKASNITYCNFKDTKVTGVDFINVNLKRTNFRGEILKDVIFFSANLKA